MRTKQQTHSLKHVEQNHERIWLSCETHAHKTVNVFAVRAKHVRSARSTSLLYTLGLVGNVHWWLYRFVIVTLDPYILG